MSVLDLNRWPQKPSRNVGMLQPLKGSSTRAVLSLALAFETQWREDLDLVTGACQPRESLKIFSNMC